MYVINKKRLGTYLHFKKYNYLECINTYVHFTSLQLCLVMKISYLQKPDFPPLKYYA